MRLFRIAAAGSALGLALTATAALAQGGYPGMPGYGAPAPYGAPYAPPGAVPPGYPPPMPGAGPMVPPGPGPAGPVASPYPGAPGASPMASPDMASQSGTPMADPSQIYGTSSSPQAQQPTDPSQGYPGAMAAAPSAPGAVPPGYPPGMPSAGPMGPNGPLAGPAAMPAGATGQSTVNAVPGMPPLANTQAPLPPGSVMGPQAMAQLQGTAPSIGPSGVPSMQASPASQQATPSNQGGTATDTVHVVDADGGGVSLDPSPIRYPVNRPITWVNNSSAIIQLVSEDGSTFDSGPLGPGDTYVYTPNLIGSVYYRDKLHPWVRGVVVSIQPR